MLSGCVSSSIATSSESLTTSTTTSTTTSSSTSTSVSTSSETIYFTVTFMANGGSSVTSQQVASGSTVTMVSSTREDYTLAGWYLEANFVTEWHFATDLVTESITLFAKWSFSYLPLGSGTELDPYQVATLKDLDAVRTGKLASSATMYFIQTEDITLVSEIQDIEGFFFLGHYDGNDRKITITGDSGVFYGNEGTIYDINIDADIETETSNSIGALAHYNLGLIENAQIIGIGVRSLVGIVGTYAEGIGGAGAIVGTNGLTGTIQNSTANINVQARVGGGGIAGVNKGEIHLSTNFGMVGEASIIYISNAEKSVAKFSYMGGIAGVNEGLIHQSQNRGKVFAQRAGSDAATPSNLNRVFGGIAGLNTATGVVTETYSAYGTTGPTVHADRVVGGIVGHNFGEVSFSYTAANIGARANLGGIVGLLDETDLNTARVFNVWTNSQFRSDGNEEDEIGAFLSTDVSNWYNAAKYIDNSYYHGTRGMNPVGGTNNLSGASVTLDMTALLNTGLEAGHEKFVSTGGSSSGNPKTKLAWQQADVTYFIGEDKTTLSVHLGDTPTLPTPEKNGYEFIEWRLDLADPLSRWTIAGVTESMTIYAYFAPIAYNIDYKLDGGTNNQSNPSTYTIESSLITLEAPTRAHASFSHWKLGEGILNSIPTGSTGDKQFEAVWTFNEAVVKLQFMDTDLESRSLVEAMDEAIVMPTLTKSGFTFDGWSVNQTTVAFQPEQTVVYGNVVPNYSGNIESGVLRLYPLFTETQYYTIAFDANGGTGTMAEVTGTIGQAYTLPANAFSAPDYIFHAWSFNNTYYNPGDQVLNPVGSGETATFTAIWKTANKITNNPTFTLEENFTADPALPTTQLISNGWTIYRNNSTNVTSYAATTIGGALKIDATIVTTATNLNFYAYVPFDTTGIAVGAKYLVSFDVKVDSASGTYANISALVRNRATGTWADVTSRATFSSLTNEWATLSQVLTVTAIDATRPNFALLITLAPVGGGTAGTFTYTFDNVSLTKLGSAS